MNEEASRPSKEPSPGGSEGRYEPISEGGISGLADSLRVEVHQMDFASGDFQANLARIGALIRASQSELVVFPEACTTGFEYARLEEVGRFNVQALEEIRKIARESARGVILPLLVESEGRYYNRQYCLGPHGETLAWYDKIHLIGVLKEDRYLTPGSRPTTLDYPALDGGSVRLGLATCYDLRFPELFRSLTLDHGAELFILPAQWPRQREEHLRTLARARAVENQCITIVCNGVNQYSALDLCGRSALIDAGGRVLREASNTHAESFSMAIDFKEARRWRRAFPVLKDAIL